MYCSTNNDIISVVYIPERGDNKNNKSNGFPLSKVISCPIPLNFITLYK